MGDLVGAKEILRASRDLKLRLVRMLLDGGTQIDVRSTNQETPLILACASNGNQGEKEKLVKYLIRNRAKVNLQDTQGRTALMHACITTSPDNLIQALLDAKANPWIEDNARKTAFDYSLNAGSLGTVRLLITACRDSKYLTKPGSFNIEMKRLEEQMERLPDPRKCSWPLMGPRLAPEAPHTDTHVTEASASNLLTIVAEEPDLSTTGSHQRRRKRSICHFDPIDMEAITRFSEKCSAETADTQRPLRRGSLFNTSRSASEDEKISLHFSDSEGSSSLDHCSLTGLEKLLQLRDSASSSTDSTESLNHPNKTGGTWAQAMKDLEIEPPGMTPRPARSNLEHDYNKNTDLLLQANRGCEFLAPCENTATDYSLTGGAKLYVGDAMEARSPTARRRITEGNIQLTLSGGLEAKSPNMLRRFTVSTMEQEKLKSYLSEHCANNAEIKWPFPPSKEELLPVGNTRKKSTEQTGSQMQHNMGNTIDIRVSSTDIDHPHVSGCGDDKKVTHRSKCEHGGRRTHTSTGERDVVRTSPSTCKGDRSPTPTCDHREESFRISDKRTHVVARNLSSHERDVMKTQKENTRKPSCERGVKITYKSTYERDVTRTYFSTSGHDEKRSRTPASEGKQALDFSLPLILYPKEAKELRATSTDGTPAKTAIRRTLSDNSPINQRKEQEVSRARSSSTCYTEDAILAAMQHTAVERRRTCSPVTTCAQYTRKTREKFSPDIPDLVISSQRTNTLMQGSTDALGTGTLSPSGIVESTTLVPSKSHKINMLSLSSMAPQPLNILSVSKAEVPSQHYDYVCKSLPSSPLLHHHQHPSSPSIMHLESTEASPSNGRKTTHPKVFLPPLNVLKPQTSSETEEGYFSSTPSPFDYDKPRNLDQYSFKPISPRLGGRTIRGSNNSRKSPDSTEFKLK